MEWAEERDRLIAETMVFVRSVSDRKLDIGERDTKPAARPRIEAAPIEVIKRVEPKSVEPRSIETKSIATKSVELKSVEPLRAAVRYNIEASNTQASDIQASDIQAAAPAPRPRISGDIRAEMQSRIASFRAHQERFRREREAFFSATLAKMRVDT